jgi:hypothetical protein
MMCVVIKKTAELPFHIHLGESFLYLKLGKILTRGCVKNSKENYCCGSKNITLTVNLHLVMFFNQLYIHTFTFTLQGTKETF